MDPLENMVVRDLVKLRDREAKKLERARLKLLAATSEWERVSMNYETICRLIRNKPKEPTP